jgi:hypothetical protein
MKQFLFIEFFSGSGHLSRAFFEAGFTVIQWDILLGEQYNLLVHRNRQSLRRLIGHAAAVHFGTPCTSFTLARRGNAPRSRHFPLGKPGLSEVDAQKVKVGNILAAFTCAQANRCHNEGRPWMIENPAGSRLWHLPGFQRLQQRKGIIKYCCSYCAFGCRWRKNTSFLVGGGMRNLEMLDWRCPSHKGVCMFSGTRHKILTGHENGVSMTKVAEAYPKDLCRRLASAFRNFFMQRLLHYLEN